MAAQTHPEKSTPGLFRYLEATTMIQNACRIQQLLACSRFESMDLLNGAGQEQLDSVLENWRIRINPPKKPPDLQKETGEIRRVTSKWPCPKRTSRCPERTPSPSPHRVGRHRDAPPKAVVGVSILDRTGAAVDRTGGPT